MRRIGPQDEIHLVTYADSANVVFRGGRAADATSLEAAIDGVTAQGSTNIMSGIKAGLGVLEVWGRCRLALERLRVRMVFCNHQTLVLIFFYFFASCG